MKRYAVRDRVCRQAAEGERERAGRLTAEARHVGLTLDAYEAEKVKVSYSSELFVEILGYECKNCVLYDNKG